MAELLALSPSRANDFVQCPLKFRLRTLDRLPEPPSEAAFRGTLVHAVLERLFDADAPERTIDTAVAGIGPALDALREKDPDTVAELFPRPDQVVLLQEQARTLLEAYFALELPDRLEPAAREEFVSAPLSNGLLLRGFVDRTDIAPGGQVRLVDYKTGKQPKPQYGREADFQMRFYALVHWLSQRELVHTLQLFYLGSRSTVTKRPTAADIERTETEILGLWDQIVRAAETDEWRPRKSPLCNWCSFKPICPAWGGTPPPTPEITAVAGR
ncbi:RecB family exonuclease [Brevibacterium yomogidense]|uniref:RecB family exonuclease n=1 Tax=Brevibacterium yomogidense TaxID=946573 RepID=UPI0018E02908|nr:PD-(D/E)XK nuclease family protein [Brevibacterium yomogidense]